jgi:hypothetical protein
MLFVDYLGPTDLFQETRGAIQERVAAALRTPARDVVVRRQVVESDYPGVEVWIEVSSDEQLVRHGRRLAQEVSGAVRAVREVDVWVMFRVVPLDHAFLNGAPRRRDGSSLAD